jgi:hypothetical protein
MNIPDALGELEKAAEAIAQAWDDHDCHDEVNAAREDELAASYDEGQRDLVRGLLSQLARLEAGSQLPFPVYNDVMTYDEVRKLVSSLA